MRFKKLTLILSSTIALAACNGPTSETQSNKSNEMVPNPRIVGNSSKSLLAGDSTPAFIEANAGVQIGDGYDPDTKKVLHVPINDDTFAYLNLDKAKSPIISPVCSQQDYAKELGGMSSSSSNQIFGTSIKGAINTGLYKAALAGSFNKEDATSNNQFSISKIFGAAVSCNIDTIVAPDKVGNDASDSYEYMQEALMNSSNIKKAILKIRQSKTLSERQNAIKEFYKKYGTYMVSGVKAGQIALKALKMTQQDSATEGQWSAGAAASFSSPFASLEGSASFASAEKFTNAGWNIELTQYLFPNTTPLKDNLKEMQTEFETMKSGGIIDFTKLKPDPAKIDPTKITKPEIPPVEIDTAARQELRTLKNNYNEFTTLIPSTQKEMNAKPSTRDEKITSYTKIITNLTTIQKDMDYIDEKINYLSTSEYNKYSTEYLPKVREWTSSNLIGKYQDLLKQTQDEGSQLLQSSGSKALTPQQIIKQINKVIASGESAVDIAESEATNKKIQDDKQIELIKEFGVTYSRYEEKKFVDKFKSEASAISLDRGWAKQYTQATTTQGKSEVFRQWKAARILIAPTDTLKAIQEFKQEWSAEFNPAPSVPLYVTKAEADEYEKEMHTVVKSQMLGGAGNDNHSLYGEGNVVMDFKVTPWAKIFPELANTIAVDDGIEDNELTIIKAVKEYTKIYRYLKVMSSLDGHLSNLRITSESTYKEMLELERGIQSAIENTDSTITFKEKNYDLSNQGSYNDLFNTISQLNSSSAMVKSDWYKVTKKLYDNNLIGSFGSFLGFKPEYPNPIDKFGLLVNPITKLPSVEEMDKGYTSQASSFNQYNFSGVRLFFQKIVNLLDKKANPDSTGPKEHTELPRGIFETYRTTKGLDLKEPEYQKDYLVNSYNSVAAVALKDLTKLPTKLNGVSLAVKSSTRISGDRILDIGLIDSNGRVIGAYAGNNLTNGSFDGETVTYDLNLSNPIGGDENPGYVLEVGEKNAYLGSSLVTEFNLQGIGDTSYKRILLGIGLPSNFFNVGAFDLITCSLATAPSINSNFTCLSDYMFINDKFKINADAFFTYGFYTSYRLDLSRYFMELGPALMWNNSLRNLAYTKTMPAYHDLPTYAAKGHYMKAWVTYNPVRDASKEEWFKLNFPNAFQPNKAGTYKDKLPLPIYQHKLVITPINKQVISDMANMLNNDDKQPLLPTYPYWGM